MKNSGEVTELTAKKITTSEEFDSLFGAGAVMGADGAPTPIDFNKEFVLAVYAPTTNKETTIQPLKIEKSGGQLYYHYSVKEGKDLNFQIKPSSIILVDKKNDATVNFIKD